MTHKEDKNVTLIVGGHEMKTTRQTLLKDVESDLARILREKERQNDNGPIFLDVDPDLFAPVLNYLRHDKLILGPSDVPGVLCVAHQLGLQRMEKELKDYMANQALIEKDNKVTVRFRDTDFTVSKKLLEKSPVLAKMHGERDTDGEGRLYFETKPKYFRPILEAMKYREMKIRVKVGGNPKRVAAVANELKVYGKTWKYYSLLNWVVPIDHCLCDCLNQSSTQN